MVNPLHLTAAALMRENGFVPDFPEPVLAEVERIAETPDTPPNTNPRDLRALPWSSIDNRESRDLDQVEVAEQLADGGIRVRIGIADVDALVPARSQTDVHAGTNTTSVYTGVAVFPMLPEVLSTDLTSLNEGEDRAAMVIEFDVSADGALSDADVYPALVHNHAKLVYEEVGAWLAGEDAAPQAIEANARLREQLLLQDEAGRRLRAARELAGTLDLESVEARPVVVNGKVIDLALTQRNRGRELIEEFMVAANRAVALFLIEHGSVSIRRVVREPNRWDRIVALAADVGEQLPPQPNSKALADFLERRRAADPEHFADLSLSIVKLLGPGVYVLERRLGDRRNASHFGLAVADYVHSTAPNRRYVDLITQRLLRAAIARAAQPYTDEELTAIAQHCTERSSAARKVERTMRKIAAAALMAERIGESFPAIITAASPKGVYARVLKPPVEGRVVRGEEGLDIGDTVRLTLLSADAERGYIDFAHGAAPEHARKRERTRRKKAAADRLRSRIGETFDAVVTGVTVHGTWVRLADGLAEGRLLRGYKGLSPGMKIPVRLIDADTVHGFIDFEYAAGIAAPKRERLERKRAAARRLRNRIGESFEAVVTGVSAKATWIRLTDTGVEGRLVRGRSGLSAGNAIRVVLLSADEQRGYIDFARDSAR